MTVRPRSCECRKKVHEHGCVSRYQNRNPARRCRCDLCRAGYAENRKRRTGAPTHPFPRSCACTAKLHEHGCVRRYHQGCREDDGCRAAMRQHRLQLIHRQKAEGRWNAKRVNRNNTAYRRRRRARLREQARVDDVVVERILRGWPVTANVAEIEAAVVRLQALGVSLRSIPARTAGLVTKTDVSRVRKRQLRHPEREEGVA